MDRIKKWLHGVSIPMAFMICGLTCLVAALSFTKITTQNAQKNLDEVEGLYTQYLDPALITMVSLHGDEVFDEIITEPTFSESDRQRYNFFAGLKEIAAILWYSVCLCAATLIFYLWKIKKPFRVLNHAVEKIADNNLDFHIDYAGQDEFGRLCHAFEIMRQELAKSNLKMWNSVEEHKRLNAAFAHDLRTPLTIMQGQTELLLESLKSVDDPGDEMRNSIDSISKQIKRLNAFVDTMGTLQRLEDYEATPKQTSASTIKEMLAETATLLFPTGTTEICSELEEQNLLLDIEALTQICENILSNAARYAKEKITVFLYKEQEYLVIIIEDDGPGFTKKDLANASLAYYRGEKTEDGVVPHFGLGLYISSLLAEKLGGNLQFDNKTDGSAKISIKIHSI